jgi:hypothetical protein
MSSEGFVCELRTTDSSLATVSGATPQTFLEELERRIAGDVALEAFVLDFAAPVPLTLQEQVSATVLQAIKVQHGCTDEEGDWVDDLGDESGWQGVRATVDDGLAPHFAGRPDGMDEKHCGVWTDDRTFLHLEVDALTSSGSSSTAWSRALVSFAHWHPGSMASGAWSDDLHLVDPGSGPGVLLEARWFDDDGQYYTVEPLPTDPEKVAQHVADFVTSSELCGAQDHLLSMLAHGFPLDGSAGPFPVDLLDDTDNPGYEISSVLIDPPADVRELLVRRGTLDAEGARALREAILAGAAGLLEDEEEDEDEDQDENQDEEELAHFGAEWVQLLARLEDVAEGRTASGNTEH